MKEVKELNNLSIMAEKEGIKRPFTQAAWNLLPSHKNGWNRCSPDEAADNTAPPKEEDLTDVGNENNTPPEALGSSLKFTLDDLGDELRNLKTEADINAFMEGETRAGAKKMAEKRLSELK